MQEAIRAEAATIETAQARMAEIEEEQNSEDGLLADLENVNATEVNRLLKQLKPAKKVKVPVADGYNIAAEPRAEYRGQSDFEILEESLECTISIKGANAKIKNLNAELETLVLDKYPTRSATETKTWVLDHRWQANLQ